ncbi:MAG TPA: hypothetical protein VMT05_11560 [Terriglobales bacterium]|jgi:hypothetical protein|nr:hypothetical protein [Terriglobales bacterium]
MKKMLLIAVVVMFLLRAWLGAERRASTLDMNLVTSFNFFSYPACGSGRTSYCIQAFRFYDADSQARLAEVPATGMRGAQRIVASVRVNAVPRRAYVVTVYPDDHGILKEGPPGKVSTFDDAGH